MKTRGKCSPRLGAVLYGGLERGRWEGTALAESGDRWHQAFQVIRVGVLTSGLWRAAERREWGGRKISDLVKNDFILRSKFRGRETNKEASFSDAGKK